MLLAVAEHTRLDSPAIPRIATGLSGGIARTRGPCGAYTGGVLALGLTLGRDDAGAAGEECYVAVQQLRDSFTARFGSTDCYTLTGCDLGDPVDRERFRTEGIRERCSEYTAQAARMVVALLDESPS